MRFGAAFGFLLLLSAAHSMAELRIYSSGKTAILKWNATKTPGIAGYNVYRAACKMGVSKGRCPVGAEGMFVKIGSSTSPTYSDKTVVKGSAYSYYVTAFCPAKGCSARIKGESAASKHVGAQIPK